MADQLNIVELIEQQVNQCGKNIALVYQDNFLNYAMLNSRANQLARHLKREGIEAEHLVALALPKSPELIIAILAVLKAGGAYLPLDYKSPRERLRLILEDSQSRCLITDTSNFVDFSNFSGTLININNEQLFSGDATNLESPITPTQLAYVIYTSGSSGLPKGVMIEQGALSHYLSFALKNYDFITSKKGGIFHSSIAFDLTITSIYLPLLQGGTLYIMDENADLEDLAQAINHNQDIKLLKVTPSHLKALNTYLDFEQLTDMNLIVGGEALSPEDVTPWLARENIRVFNEYGPTEATVGCTLFNIQRGVYETMPIGQPIDNTHVYLLDKELKLASPGEAGEIGITGLGLARGYLNQSNLTEEKFILNPFVTEEEKQRGENLRLYRSGDLGKYSADGNLLYLGREDSQVKIQGFRIDLQEIESLLNSHHDVLQCHVQDMDYYDSRKLVAYIVPGDFTPSEAELREFLHLKSPLYMIPAFFIYLKAIPLTLNGKVDKAALPLPERHEPRIPQTQEECLPLEQELKTLWMEVLKVSTLSIHDNFYRIGGDSIISLQLVAKARRQNLYFTVQDLFNYPTIATLAIVVKRQLAPLRSVSSRDSAYTKIPLSPIQHWFFQHDFLDKNHFNQAILLSSTRPIDTALLQEAFSTIFHHHEALRLRFYLGEEGWQQEVKVAEALNIEIVNLAEKSYEDLAKTVSLYKQEAQKELNIAEGRLIKVIFFDCGEKSPPQILIIIHHLVIDTVSWRILIEDLEMLYPALLNRRPTPLLPQSSSYFNWVNALLIYAKSDEFALEKNYWRQVEENIVLLKEDSNLGPLSNHAIDTISLSLTQEETRLLLQDANKAYRTQINDILLTALVLAAGDTHGKYQLSFCLEGHGREESIGKQIDLSHTLGWFTSLFPVNLSVENPIDLEKSLKKVKETLLHIPQKGIGYGLTHYENQGTFFHQASRPNLIFNYLGQWANTIKESNIFEFVENISTACNAKANAPFFPIEINTEVNHEALSTTWTYSQHHFTHETIKKLAESFKKRLSEIIRHCCDKHHFGYTPSDFKLTNISQIEIDTYFSKHANIEDIYPLSPMQFGMLFHHLSTPASNSYFVQTIFKIEGNVDRQVLQQACQIVCDKHAILRTGFIYQGLREPLQYVLQSLTVNFEYKNWTNFSETESESQFNAFLLQEQEKGFALDRAPLFRVALLQITPKRYYFYWAQHHILLDGWSSSLVLNDLFSTYLSLLHKRPNLAGLSRPLFSHYIEWQKTKPQEEARNFWQTYLASLEDVTHLGCKVSPKEGSSEEYETDSLPFSLIETQSIRDFAKKNNLTLNTVILAAITLTLKSYLPYQELVIGVTVSGRNPELTGVEDIAGLLINTLPLRVNAPPLTKIAEFLKDLQQTIHTINQYAYLPLAEVQALAKTDRHLFNAIFVFEKYPIDEVLLNETALGFSIEEFIGIEQTEYPLTITALEGKTLEIIINYQTTLFDKHIIRRILKNFSHILKQVLHKEDVAIQHIDSLSHDERNKILHWGKAAMIKPQYSTLSELFELQAHNSPHATALICNGKTLDYKTLNAKANQLAHYLCSQGAHQEKFVAIFCDRSVEIIIAILAVLKTGAAYVPVDTGYPIENLRYILKDSQSSILLTQTHYAQHLSLDIPLICLDTLDLEAFSERNIEAVNSGNNLAYIIYTSGSTGKPKGAMIEHASICARLAAYQSNYPLTLEDVVLCQTSMSFDVSLAELFWPFSVGAKVVLSTQRGHEHLIELENLIYQYKVTFAQFVPSVLKVFLMHIDENKTYALKGVCSGGEALDYKLVEEFYKKLPLTKLENAYGPTEASVDATIYHCSKTDSRTSAFVPIGRPLANGNGYILNPSMHPVPIGVVGELYLSGVTIARGYLNHASLNKEKFLSPSLFPHLQEKSTRLYRTGDLCQWLEDGNIEYIGRIDNQIKIRGFRVELEEIEEVLLKNFELKDAVVIVKEDSTKNKQLLAYVIPREEMDLSTLRSQLSHLLPSHMLPNDFIALNHMPLTANGKADRKKIAQIPYQTHAIQYVAPRNQVEYQLTDLWKTLLNREEIGIEDNFFFLGGNSILATQLILILKREFNGEVAFVHFFNDPTIKHLASILSNDYQEARPHHLLEQIQKDIALAKLVTREVVSPSMKIEEPDILLTGASGFLGAHLLEQIIKATRGNVYCLVRGKNEQDAAERLHTCFKQYKLMHLVNHPQIVPVLGDIAQAQLGLAAPIYQMLLENVSEIYHNGALVHHVYDYSRLQKENVHSTIEMLRLASRGRAKTINFFSTLSTGLDKNDEGSIVEDFVKKMPSGNEGGYTLSKWTSEKMLADASERGFSCTIHRLPQIMGSTRMGIMPTEKLHIALLMKSWIKFAIAPQGMGIFEFFPVDFIAKSLVKICSDSEAHNKVFNYGHPNPITFDQMINWLNEFGYNISFVDLEEWQTRISSYVETDHVLYPLLSLYTDKINKNPSEGKRTGFREDTLITENMNKLMKKHQLTLPSLNKEVLFCYFNYLSPWFNQ